MTRIFLTTDILQEKTAASKARVDVLDILKKNGYQPVYLPKKKNFTYVIGLWKELSAISKGKTHVVVEYPFWMKRRMYTIKLLCMLKGIRLYGIIHDVAALRLHTAARPEISFFNLFDGLVSHNASMSKWLRENGYRKKIVNLDVFDYCLENDKEFAEDKVNGKLKVLYAGNLAYNKATFVYDKGLKDTGNVELCLYGQFFEKERLNGSMINYKGVFNPNLPDLQERYHFGLIWEGTSIDTCAGEMGEYTKFNNPHKFSLYLSLGLPVIVWEGAAIASYVKANNIGFTIGNFKELKSIAENMNTEKYQEYRRNVAGVSGKVKKGYFLTTAINELTKS
jgi:hypothetical protein